MKRTVSALLAKGMFDPAVAGGLIQTLSEYIVTDPDLTAAQDARVRRRDEPGRPDEHHDVSDRGRRRGPSRATPCSSRAIDGDNMQAILAVFRGEATLADIPDQVLETAPRRHAAEPIALTSVSTAHVPTEAATRRRPRPPRCRRVIADRTSSASFPTRTSPADVSGITPGVVEDPSERCRSVGRTGRPGLREPWRRPARRVSASASSDSGATITNSSRRRAAPTTSPGAVARQSDSSTVILRPARDRDN